MKLIQLILLFFPLISYSQDGYVDSLYREYRVLKEQEAIMDDSVAIQMKKIEDLLDKVRIGKLSEIELKKEREEIEEMKKIMEIYQYKIDSLNRENMRLEELELKKITE